MQPSGSLFYRDEGGSLYRTTWETIKGDLDITSIVYTPFVWGESPRGYVDGNLVFRRGIITTTRQVLRPLVDGYEIIAEGGSQEVGFFQTNFPCGEQPLDKFTHHLDCAIQDEPVFQITDGSRWADPDDPDDDDMIWGDVDSGGNPTSDVTGADILEWLDVWA